MPGDFTGDLMYYCDWHSGMQQAFCIEGVSGCMGQDEDKEGTPIRAIEFERIKGGKPCDKDVAWFQELVKDIGQVA